MAQAGHDDTSEDRRINEDYKIWKKNTPFLYDVVLTSALEWPSLTAQWLPGKKTVQGGDYYEHQLIMGTHTSEGEMNYLQIAVVKLPTEDTEIDARKYDEERGELGGYGGSAAKIETKIKINHPGEVNKARYCPQNPFLIATKTPEADVLVFDYSKHPSKPTDNEVKPTVRCKGHDAEGYGLAWNPTVDGRLLSGADDKTICMWDVGAGPSGKVTTELQPTLKMKGHSEVIEDVAWHRQHKELFASCGDDKQLMLWDARDCATAGPRMRTTAHEGDVMSVAFNPFSEFLLLTGGTDKLVKLWDSRSLKAPVHTFEAHEDDVLSVQWSPFNESVFATSSADRRVIIWDCGKIGVEQPEEDSADGPPELMFVHGGHTAKVSDFNWCEDNDWFIASVAEDNILQVWQPAENIYNEDNGGDDTDGAGAGGRVSDGDLE